MWNTFTSILCFALEEEWFWFSKSVLRWIIFPFFRFIKQSPMKKTEVFRTSESVAKRVECLLPELISFQPNDNAQRLALAHSFFFPVNKFLEIVRNGKEPNAQQQNKLPFSCSRCPNTNFQIYVFYVNVCECALWFQRTLWNLAFLYTFFRIYCHSANLLDLLFNF